MCCIKTPDREDVNESDGMHFNGYNDGERHTAWNDDDGNLDYVTDTPVDD